VAAQISLSADVIVVGSGPGGSTVSRELTKAGKRVLLLERGADERKRFYYGTYLGAVLYSDRFSLLYTTEGLNIIRPLLLGGATSMYCGCAGTPPEWLKTKYGIHLEEEMAATITELDVKPLPEGLLGTASTRIARAGQALGQEWYAQPKFMYPYRNGKFRCGASCMLGCRCGAKWHAAEFVDEAVDQGLEVRTRALVQEVMIENQRAVGVSGLLAGVPFRATAETVVISAGGIGTPRILQASGLKGAGVGMTMDTTVMVYGITREPGTGKEPPMTWSWENDADGYMLSTLIDPWLIYPLMAIRDHWTRLFTWPRWNRILGIMIKLKDEVSGGVFADGTISKHLTPLDRERLMEANGICERILLEAGADPSSLFMTPLRGTHPSATVRIGTLLDRELKTDVNGLYVCDASVFPEALDRPTVLTIISLAKRLASHLLKGSGTSRPS
jgi:choline dehydrogenase-like flavoprotein